MSNFWILYMDDKPVDETKAYSLDDAKDYFGDYWDLSGFNWTVEESLDYQEDY